MTRGLTKFENDGVKMKRFKILAMWIMLGMDISALTGCQYNKATQAAEKDAVQIGCNVSTHLDCYLN